MDAQRREVDENFDYFERNLSRFLTDHKGKYVLLRHRQEIDFFERPSEALRAGMQHFPDGVFSIQEVTGEPLDLGFLTLA